MISSKRKSKKVINIFCKIFAILGFLFCLIFLYYLIFPNEYFMFNFFVEESGEDLNGKVYLNGVYLGDTISGKLKVNVLNLSSGELMLSGYYNGMPSNLYWDFKGEIINEGEQIFSASERDLAESTFNVSNLNLLDIEKEIFNLVNLEREKYPAASFRDLRWNEKISEIAREHSQDMLEKEYFSHNTLENIETLESSSFEDRLKKENIFYLVSNENLIFFSVSSDTDIAKEAINGWLESPGHRSTLLDLDNIYSDAGVGIACRDNLCYITMDFISLKEEYLNQHLDYNFVQLIPLYPEGYGFNFSTLANLNFVSSSQTKIRLTNEKDDFEKIVNRDSPQGVIWTKSTKQYNGNINITPNLYLIIESNVKPIYYNLTIDYFPNLY